MLAHLGLDTNRLIRISYGPFQLGDLPAARSARSAAACCATSSARSSRRRPAPISRRRSVAPAAEPRRAAPAEAAARGRTPCASSAVSSAAGRSPTPRFATPSGRPPTVCARRSSTSSPTPMATRSPARASSTSSPAPARSASRRCRAAPRYALFVEEGVEARGLIRRNVEALRPDRPHRASSAAMRPASARPARVAPFDLVFADPPYGAGLGEQALASALAGGWLEAGALCVLEETRKGRDRADRRASRSWKCGRSATRRWRFLRRCNFAAP